MIGLVPEFIVPQDGHDKQDCENAAAKRWLSQHGPRFSPLKVTVLGDDLYCHQPLCQQLLDQQLDFILVCRPESHTTLYEHLEGIDLPTVTTKRWTGKVEETYTYRYLNAVPLRDSDDALLNQRAHLNRKLRFRLKSFLHILFSYRSSMKYVPLSSTCLNENGEM